MRSLSTAFKWLVSGRKQSDSQVSVHVAEVPSQAPALTPSPEKEAIVTLETVINSSHQHHQVKRSRRLAGQPPELKGLDLNPEPRGRRTGSSSRNVEEDNKTNSAAPTVAQNPKVVEEKPKEEEEIGTYIRREAIKMEAFPDLRRKVGYSVTELPKMPQKDAIPLPKRDSLEEKLLQQKLKATTLPDLRNVSLPAEIDSATESLAKLLYDTATPSVAPKPVKCNEIERLNLELHSLASLSKSSNQATAQGLIDNLKRSKRMFASWSPDTLRATAKLARAFIGRSLRDARRSKARRRLLPRKEDLAAEFRKAPKTCFEKIKNGEGSKKSAIPETTLSEHFRKTIRGSKSAKFPLAFDLSPMTDAPGIPETRPRKPFPDEDQGDSITHDELIAALRGANKNSAPGRDQLSLRLISLSGAKLTRWLARLFEKIRISGHIPHCWRNGEVQLLFKKGDDQEPSNWRPITLLSVLYKLFMTMLARRFHGEDRKRKLEKGNTFLSESQRGFRPNVSGCTDNIALLKSWERLVAEHGEAYILFVDFKNAFGSVDHDVLWQAFEWLNLPRYMIDLVKSAYDGARIRIRFGNGEVTPDLTVERGVLQGCPFRLSLLHSL
jgi:hypothetical protein